MSTAYLLIRGPALSRHLIALKTRLGGVMSTRRLPEELKIVTVKQSKILVWICISLKRAFKGGRNNQSFMWSQWPDRLLQPVDSTTPFGTVPRAKQFQETACRTDTLVRRAKIFYKASSQYISLHNKPFSMSKILSVKQSRASKTGTPKEVY